MHFKFKTIIPAFLASLVLGFILASFSPSSLPLPDMTDESLQNNNAPLNIESVQAKNADISSFEKVSECKAGIGTIRKTNGASTPDITTFSDRLIGIQMDINGDSEPVKSNFLYLQEPPKEAECQKGKTNQSATAELPSLSDISQMNQNQDLKLTSDGSRICKPGLGITRVSSNSNTEIITFDNKVIGFRSGEGDTVFLKRPPTASECAEREYQTTSNRSNVSGKSILDLHGGLEERKFYHRPEKCEEWYGGLSSLSCDYTTEGIENVSLVTDPTNYIPSEKSKINYSEKIVTDDLESSWDLEILPDNQLLITQEKGRVLLYNDSIREIGRLNVLKDEMSGLMGAAVDPNYSENKYIYLYYTYNYTEPYRNVREKHILSRISRFTLEDGKLENEQTLLDSIPGHNYHTGGRLEFGPDNKLYATTGDGGSWQEKPYESQDPNYLNGKILRMNKDGSVPEDNPFNDSLVFSTGHRNPQGLAWRPETNTLYSSEHGPWRHDEINRIEAGENYGWGRYKCDEVRVDRVPEMKDQNLPIFCPKKWTIAPSGSTFVDNAQHPWYDKLLVSGLRSKHVHSFTLDNGSVTQDSIFYIPKEVPGSRRIRDIEHKNDSLWVLGDSKWLIKLTPETKIK